LLAIWRDAAKYAEIPSANGLGSFGGETMRCCKARLLVGATTLVLLTSVAAHGADIAICSIAEKPASFNHQNVTMQGTPLGVKETTSHRGNDYATFKLQDPSGCGAVTIFTWGHPALKNGDQVRAEGVFETEHHQDSYTFHNELEATRVTSVPR
jgi:hypothetical protein